ncbi:MULTISPECIES: hypothetical protein [Staphylococcus]|uniref:hypothetical protein n=1 Tax=Staphylococcus TaxID=1279 RepID=UPI0034C67772
MLDEPLTILGNILHMIGNISMAITVMIFILVLLYVLIYSKTDFFQGTTPYMYKENVKKWLWIVIGGLVVTAMFHILGAWVTPDIARQSVLDYN